MILIGIGVTILVFWFYIIFLREFLEARLPESGYAWWHRNVEDRLWAASRTILYARLYWLGGIIVGAQQLLANSGVNTQPLIDELAKRIPEQWRGLAIALFLILTGAGIEWLRWKTNKAVREPAS